MERVNLLSLPSFVNSYGQTIYLIKDASVKYELDWSKVSSQVDLIFGFFGNGLTFDLLEINSKSDARVSYMVGADVTLKYALAELDISNHSERHFEVDTNGIVNAGMANFASGISFMNVVFNLNGTGAKALWRLATVAKEGDNKLYNISFNHEAKNTHSRMENYGVVLDKSELEFAGISHIKNGATNSFAEQIAKITLFDENSIGKANPILKIDENEVSASHGATVGKVNEEHLFYLTSRGIDERAATKILTLGYLNPILSIFEGEEVGEYLKEAIDGGLSRHV